MAVGAAARGSHLGLARSRNFTAQRESTVLAMICSHFLPICWAKPCISLDILTLSALSD